MQKEQNKMPGMCCVSFLEHGIMYTTTEFYTECYVFCCTVTTLWTTSRIDDVSGVKVSG